MYILNIKEIRIASHVTCLSVTWYSEYRHSNSIATEQDSKMTFKGLQIIAKLRQEDFNRETEAKLESQHPPIHFGGRGRDIDFGSKTSLLL